MDRPMEQFLQQAKTLQNFVKPFFLKCLLQKTPLLPRNFEKNKGVLFATNLFLHEKQKKTFFWFSFSSPTNPCAVDLFRKSFCCSLPLASNFVFLRYVAAGSFFLLYFTFQCWNYCRKEPKKQFVGLRHRS